MPLRSSPPGSHEDKAVDLDTPEEAAAPPAPLDPPEPPPPPPLPRAWAVVVPIAGKLGAAFATHGGMAPYLTIKEVVSGSSLAAFNEKNEEDAVLAGDRILALNLSLIHI